MVPRRTRQPNSRDQRMILPAQAIRKLCLNSDMIYRFHERGVQNGMSYGLSVAGYDIRILGGRYVQPGDFVLASSIEKFDMPNDILAVVHDKSTWARRGLAVQNTVLEPGWRGYLTLEITNHSKESLEIMSGDPIAQIIFHRLEEPTQHLYTGKYQDQQQGAQAAKFE